MRKEEGFDELRSFPSSFAGRVPSLQLASVLASGSPNMPGKDHRSYSFDVRVREKGTSFELFSLDVQGV
jgi:hypothetical protein